MKCPYCGHLESKVIDSRPTDDGERIRRRRECIACQQRFTSYEAVETSPLMVRKKDGTLVAFDREKLMGSMLRACEKRRVTVAQIETAANEIEVQLRNTMSRECSTERIASLAMQKLRTIDEAAYVRFASVYWKFQDIPTFISELQRLLHQEEKK